MSNNSIELLLKLQGLDYQLLELERSKEYLPDMIGNLRAAITAAEKDLAEAQDQMEATQLEQKRLELRVKEKNADLERLLKQMIDIKTNKEYDALTREIEHIKSEIARSEEAILAAMEHFDNLTKAIQEKKAATDEIRSSNGSQLESIQSEVDSVGEKIRIKEDERRNVLVRLDDTLVSTYERVRKGLGGGAVVRVRHRACSGCFATLPPQLIQEIRRGERLITCFTCGRILIWDDDESE